MTEITIMINGKPQQLLENTTLQQLLDNLALCEPFATAVNQQFIPKNEYPNRPLQDGDNVELVQPIVGG